MDTVQRAPEAWQYVLVWTPGPGHSVAQLWAVNGQGRRTLWDQWESAEQLETPSLHRVLYALYEAAVTATERSTSSR